MKSSLTRQALSRTLIILALLCLPGCIFPGSGWGGGSPTASGVSNGGLYGNGSGYGFRVLNLAVQKNSTLQFSADSVASGTGSQFATKTAPAQGALTLNQDGTGTYEPNQGYEGLDQFVYTFQSSVDGPIEVNAYVNVKPCFRQPTAFPAAPNLQIISIFASNTFGGPQSFTVNVNSEPTPVTLMLISQMGPMTWTIQAQAGAQIEKIVVAAPQSVPPTVVGAPAGTPIESTQLPAYADNWTINANEDFITSYGGPTGWNQPNYINRFGTMISAVRKYFKQTETAFQGCYFATSATIPFTPASLASFCVLVPSYYSYKDQACDDKCGAASSSLPFDTWDPNDVTSNVTLSSSDLTFTVGPDPIPAPPPPGPGAPQEPPFPFGAGRALHGESCGKYYYELHLNSGYSFQTGLGYKIFPYIPEGIINLVPNPQSMYPSDGQDFPPVRPGDTLGVAADLDNGLIYYSYNGAWYNKANPAMVTNGYDMGLWTYDPVFPMIQLELNASATANFGQSPMKYPAPTGFMSGFK